uniref:Uncharacterized protein n=1 Tax=Steinernema glaseri TaxID=37863 RepID=A0A1I7ZI36_9BILA
MEASSTKASCSLIDKISPIAQKTGRRRNCVLQRLSLLLIVHIDHCYERDEGVTLFLLTSSPSEDRPLARRLRSDSLKCSKPQSRLTLLDDHFAREEAVVELKRCARGPWRLSPTISERIAQFGEPVHSP